MTLLDTISPQEMAQQFHAVGALPDEVQNEDGYATQTGVAFIQGPVIMPGGGHLKWLVLIPSVEAFDHLYSDGELPNTFWTAVRTELAKLIDEAAER